MLGQARAVGFVSTVDAARARAFYEGVLGLPLRDDGFALVADLAGAVLRITTLPDFQPGEHPVFGFEVADAHQVAAWLATRGVVFERYAFLGESQGEDGVWTGPSGAEVGWFKDPDGNLLSISTHGG